MQSADPITEVGGKLDHLEADYKEMLKKLIRLLGRVSVVSCLGLFVCV